MHPEALKTLHLYTWPRKHFRRCARVRASLSTTPRKAAQVRASPRKAAQGRAPPRKIIPAPRKSVNALTHSAIALTF